MLSTEKILNTVKEIEGISRDAEMARTLGVQQSMISMWRKRGTVPYEILLHFCEERDIDMVWLLTGEGPRHRGASEGVTSQAIDADLMAEVIEMVEVVIEHNDLTLPPAKKARLITLVYDELAEDESKRPLMEQKVVQLFKLAS